MLELKPCPFCGSNKPFSLDRVNYAFGITAVGCLECLTLGPGVSDATITSRREFGYAVDLAAVKWNQRFGDANN